MQGLNNLSQCAYLGKLLNQINNVVADLVSDHQYTKDDAATELINIARDIREQLLLKQF